jgi:hypothetical protein
MIKPVVLFGRETWAVTEEMNSAFKIREQRVLREIYGPMKEQIWLENPY